MAKTIMASKFKEQCLALLDLVASTRVPIVVTKHGRPIAQLAPLDEPEPARSTAGSVTLVSKNDEDYFSTGETWTVESE